MVSMASRTWAITRAKSTVTLVDVHAEAAGGPGAGRGAAAASRDFDGTHPVHRQSPPVRAPLDQQDPGTQRAAVLAPTRPAVPPPSTSRSTAFSIRSR